MLTPRAGVAAKLRAAPTRGVGLGEVVVDEVEEAVVVDEVGNVLTAARTYLARHLAVVPVPHGTKKPILGEWQNLRLTEADVPAHFTNGANIGVLNGKPSHGLGDVDLDAPEAVAVAGVFLPATGLVFGRSGKPRSHWEYIADPLPATTKFKDCDEDKTMLVEWLSTGAQTVWPPSTHPSGERVRFDSDNEPARVDGNALLQAVARTAACALLARHWPKTPGSRHDIANALAGYLLRNGLNEADVTTLVETAARVAGDEEARDRVQGALATARALAAGKHATGGPTLSKLLGDPVVAKLREWLGLRPHTIGGEGTTSELPVIRINGRALRDVTKDALDALAAANNPPEVFVNAGLLSRVRCDENGYSSIEPVTVPVLRHRLARVAECMKFSYDKREETYIRTPVTPPRELVEDVLAHGAWPMLPPLEGVTDVPVLRPDGSVLTTPGYDPATRLIYAPAAGLVLPAIPTTPTIAEREAARDLLLDLIAEFPFVDRASRANAFALLLTPIVRPAIKGCTLLTLIDKPKRGTGATLLAQVVEIIAVGKNSELTGVPPDEDEMRKQLASALREGARIMFFDNLSRDLDSPILSTVLTTEWWTTRVLGRTENLHLHNFATWMITGNNIQLGKDIPRRSDWVRLNAMVSQPWTRDHFKHPALKSYALENRGRLIAAILTLARAWFSAGCPKAKVPMVGSFEGATQTLGGILAHAGIKGYLDNLQGMHDQADTEETAWTAFFAAWREVYQGKTMGVAALVQDLEQLDSPLRAALPDELADGLLHDRHGESFSKRLGKALSERREAWFGKYLLEWAGKKHGGNQWRVREEKEWKTEQAQKEAAKGREGERGELKPISNVEENQKTSGIPPRTTRTDGVLTSPLSPPTFPSKQQSPQGGRGKSGDEPPPWDEQ